MFRSLVLGFILSVSCMAQDWKYVLVRTSTVTKDVYPVGKFDNRQNAIIAAKLFVEQPGVEVTFAVIDVKEETVVISLAQRKCSFCANKYVAILDFTKDLNYFEKLEIILYSYLTSKGVCSECINMDDYFKYLLIFEKNHAQSK